jgi:hypothetical protein
MGIPTIAYLLAALFGITWSKVHTARMSWRFMVCPTVRFFRTHKRDTNFATPFAKTMDTTLNKVPTIYARLAVICNWIALFALGFAFLSFLCTFLNEVGIQMFLQDGGPNGMQGEPFNPEWNAIRTVTINATIYLGWIGISVSAATFYCHLMGKLLAVNVTSLSRIENTLLSMKRGAVAGGVWATFVVIPVALLTLFIRTFI